MSKTISVRLFCDEAEKLEKVLRYLNESNSCLKVDQSTALRYCINFVYNDIFANESSGLT